MNNTQLTMILDALKNATAAGQEAFIWWLLADKIVPYLFGLMFFVIAAVTGHVITKRVLSSSDSLIKRWRDELDIGQTGILLPSERRLTIALIDRLIADYIRTRR